VNGQDHLPGPVIRQSRPTGKSQHFGSQDKQRPGVERQVKEQRRTAPAVSLTGQLPAICGGDFRIWQAGHRR
jgi:hypothetical protein